MPVIPGNEIKGIASTQMEYFQYCSQEDRPFQYIPIGFEANTSNQILVDNIIGEVFLEDIETQIWKGVFEKIRKTFNIKELK